MAEEPKTVERSKTAVRCPRCGRFMFYIEITMNEPPVGSIGTLSDFSCPNRRCGYKSMIMIGVADKDKRGDMKKVEEKLKQQIKEGGSNQ